MSKLDEVKITSLNDLFSRDPSTLSDQDIDQIVIELRSYREKVMKGMKEEKPKASAKAKSKKEATLDDI